MPKMKKITLSIIIEDNKRAINIIEKISDIFNMKIGVSKKDIETITLEEIVLLPESKVQSKNLKYLGIERETIKGAKVDARAYLPETPLQRATRDFIFEIVKSLGLLWLISKIKFLKYKDWIIARMEDNVKN